MNQGLRTLLTEIVDYAGLFPPAQLPLDVAIRNYVRYRTEPEAWMLGRFICPAAKLAALAPYRDELFRPAVQAGAHADSVRFSALGRGGDTAAAFLEGLRADVADILSFHQHHGELARVEAFETRLPAGLLRDECTSDLVQTLLFAREVFAANGLGHVPMACEAAFSAPPSSPPTRPGIPDGAAAARQTLDVAINGLSFFNTKLELERRGTPADRVSLKLRCGGTEPAVFPPAELVAHVLFWCGDVGLPLKFTAGLHHPLRRFDSALQTYMHGFINVFAAALLAAGQAESVFPSPGHMGGDNRRVNGNANTADVWDASHVWDVNQLANLLEAQSPYRFAFSDDGLRIGDACLSVEQIAAGRREIATSFGSCSFDEPRDDLRALGWLGP